jgi:hypothetical protein
MKGHMQDGKFHPHTDYKKGIRKSRDQQLKTQGTKIRYSKTITREATSDMAGYILQNTNDGDDLGNGHLSLVEGAVNGSLTEKGLKAFQELFNNVKGGTYQQPFFHGIPNMIQDQEGFILWKGKKIEHYSFDDWKEEDHSARELAEVIKSLESLNIPVTSDNISDHFKWFEENNPQWKRSSFLVVMYNKEGRSMGYEWVDAIDHEDAKKQFERRNKAGTFRQEYTYDRLESMSSEEQQRKQQEEWERR